MRAQVAQSSGWPWPRHDKALLSRGAYGSSLAGTSAANRAISARPERAQCSSRDSVRVFLRRAHSNALATAGIAAAATATAAIVLAASTYDLFAEGRGQAEL